jgi:hypothetical protein
MRKVTVFAAITLLLIVGLLPTAAFAQSATNQAWSTSITYYTPDATGGTLNIHYYQEGSATPIDADPITLDPHKAGSLFIGKVDGIGTTFAGGAVLEADVPIIATSVNIAQTGTDTNYARPLYDAFDPALASTDFFIPTVLYQKFGYTTSAIGIQNVESADVQATLKIFELGQTTPAFNETYTVKAQSSAVIDAADMAADLGAGFTGSGVIEATGKVVASAQETEDAGRAAKAFEGVAADAGATQIYMASMMCRAYGLQKQTSYYAIQNVGDAEAQVAIDFYDKAGTKVYTATGLTIGKGLKISENPCKYVANKAALEGVVGSAVIRSTNSVPLIAMGKVKGEGTPAMTETAFVGQSAGAMKVAAAYIRWKADPSAGERSYIAIMNVGTQPATNVKVTYYDVSGKQGEHNLGSLDPFIKANSNPDSAGVTDSVGDFGVNPAFGGAIEVEADQPVIVVVRVERVFGADKLAEDYNGVAIP